MTTPSPNDPLWHPKDESLLPIDVHTLLPQQEPFVMVGKLTHFSPTEVASELQVETSNLFVDSQELMAEGIIEHIAQTCAARIGYINKYILGKDISIGFIGAVRNFQLHRLPKVDECLNTLVTIKEEVFGMTLASAIVCVGEEAIAETEMKIAVREA